MTTVHDVIEVARQLSPIDQLEIIRALSHALQQHYDPTATTPSLSTPNAGQRVAGLDKGTVWMSDDFDTELTDEFWLE